MNLDVTFDVPARIMQGLASGKYKQFGGVIREAATGRIKTHLREVSGFSASRLGSSINAAVNNLEKALPTLNTVTGVLNLAVSTMGFALVLNRLKGIGQQLEQAQDVLQAIDYKIDLSFYANFQAALDLAMNTFSMTNAESRKISAYQAINRLFEAEHHYTKLADREISNGSEVADEYLSTLCLAYVTEVRCYLELEELDTARRRLHEATVALRPRFEKHINTLLTSNPAAYLHPLLRKWVGLKQLTEIYQWFNPDVTEVDVFDMQRENIYTLAQKPKEWVDSLPQAIYSTKTTKFTEFALKHIPNIGSVPGIPNTSLQDQIYLHHQKNIFGRLPATMSLMGSMAEDYNRLAMYEYEVETIHQLGMTFQEWQQLAPPSTESVNDSGLMYITLSQN